MDYEAVVRRELYEWEKRIFQRSSWFKRLTKKMQNKINSKIPNKAYDLITKSIKQMVKVTLFGSDITTTSHYPSTYSLYDRDRLLDEKLAAYRKTATAEGAGTGTGGLFLGMADFPILLQIKMKFLFEAASTYGVETKSYEERLFLLHVFQLAFSSDEKRKETYQVIVDWENQKGELLDMDWHVFQQEYRDYLDIVKLLQLLPGLGAVFGAYANHNLLDQLGETAKNAYRLRYLTEVA